MDDHVRFRGIRVRETGQRALERTDGALKKHQDDLSGRSGECGGFAVRFPGIGSAHVGRVGDVKWLWVDVGGQ